MIVDCPRCKPDDRTPASGHGGYIFWDDATPEEQIAAGTADDDGEIECPLCGGYGHLEGDDIPKAQAWQDAQMPPEPAIAGLDWANVPDPDDVPRARFRFEWVDDDTANVIAVHPVDATPFEEVRIGILGFDTAYWTFTRLDHGGTQLVGADTIECDPDTERHLREMEQESRIGAQSEAVLDGHLAAIATHTKLYRDDSRDLAVLGATIIARKWWRIFWKDGEQVVT